jgi:subtilisin family serine protease
VSFSGTSASAPVVAGAIAAVMSTSAGLTPLQAADILSTHANDGGAVGADPDYGNGSVNLGWALARADAGRVDPALTSQSYDAVRGTVSVVVQNQGAQSLAGLALEASTGGEIFSYAVPALAAGASTSIELPIDRAKLASAGKLTVRFQVVTPAGMVDQNSANNRKTGVITP